MDKILSQIRKQDRVSLFILFVIYFVLLFISYAKWGNPIVDCFRNAFVPAEILNNKLLYKDIYYIYGPAIVYLHSFIFFIFGIKLNVLFVVASIINTAIILSGYYLARQLLSPFESFICLSIFTIQNFFFPSLVQYIFPYSYEALYGSLIIILILICYVNTIKSDFLSLKWIIIAAFLTGLTSIIKQDLALIAYILLSLFFIYSALLKKMDFKNICTVSLIPILIPVIIYSILLLFIPFSDLCAGLIPIQSCFNPIGEPDFSNANMSFFIFIGYLSIVTAIVYISRKISATSPYFLNIKTFCISLFLLSICFLIIHNYLDLFFYIIFQGKLYQWLIIFFIIYLLLLNIWLFKEKKPVNFTDKIVILLIISCLIFSIRNKLFLELLFSINFYFLPFLIVLIHFLCRQIPNYFSKINKDIYRFSISFTLIGFIIIIGILYILVYSSPKVEIATQRGIYYSIPEVGNQINGTISYIEKNTTKKDTIISFPDECIFNFMTDRSTISKYYQFVPGMINSKEAETKFANNLNKTKPAMIIVSNSAVSKHYGKTQWGIDYNQYIYEWINNNYTLCKIYDNKKNTTSNYQIKIYQKTCPTELKN